MWQIFYSVPPNNFTSYKNDRNVLCQLNEKVLQKNLASTKPKLRLMLVSNCVVCSHKAIKVH